MEWHRKVAALWLRYAKDMNIHKAMRIFLRYPCVGDWTRDIVLFPNGQYSYGGKF